MLVTCYYDIYNKPHKFVEYVWLFYDLGISGIPMIIFTEPSLVNKFKIFPNVTVLGVPLEEFELYNIAMNFKGELPIYRTVEKDTKEFFALMNIKIECIKKASALYKNKTFIWIDFGILKIVKNKEVFLEKLKEVNEMEVSKMTIPGCWEVGHAFTTDQIHWRFCGGFFIIPEHYIETFYGHSKNVLTDFCKMTMYKLTWETNIWSIIETCSEANNIVWYFADHNDSILLNIENVPNIKV